MYIMITVSTTINSCLILPQLLLTAYKYIFLPIYVCMYCAFHLMTEDVDSDILMNWCLAGS